MVSFDPLITQKCYGTQIGSLINQIFIPAIKLAATGKGFAATIFDIWTMIAGVEIYLKDFVFKIKKFTLHRAKLIISAQIVGSNDTVQCSSQSDNTWVLDTPLGTAIFASLSILRMSLTYVMPFGSLMKCI